MFRIKSAPRFERDHIRHHDAFIINPPVLPQLDLGVFAAIVVAAKGTLNE
jgi:hypothetical protein